MAKINFITNAATVSPSDHRKVKKKDKNKLMMIHDIKKEDVPTSFLRNLNCSYYPSDLVTHHGRKIMAIKLSIILSLLLLAIIIQAGSLYFISIKEIDTVDFVSDDIMISSSYGSLIEVLQRERWSTLLAIHNSSQSMPSPTLAVLTSQSDANNSNTTTEILQQVMAVRNATNQQFEKRIILINASLSNQFYQRRRRLYQQLLAYRHQLDSSMNNHSNVLQLTVSSDYHHLIQLIFDWITEFHHSSDKDLLWQEIIAYHWLIHGLEKLEWLRYYGQLMEYNYSLPSSYMIWWMQAYYQQQLYIQRALAISNAVNRYYQLSLHSNTTMMIQFKLLQNQLYHQHASSSHTAYYHQLLSTWLDYLTRYQSIITSVQLQQSGYLTSQLHHLKLLTQIRQTTSIAILVLVLVISPCSFLLVAKFIRRIQKYVAKLVIKSDDLEYEKSRTDDLLYQLLPPSVAEQLKLGRAVHAESFDDATIYFSDVVGFTTICHSSTAIQVVYMLNALYTLFDRKIDHHDVYKIETIGDAYMVVSGVPKRTGGRFHAKEIANMALDICADIQNIKVPHMEGRQIKLRIGIHTGMPLLILTNYN